MISQIIKCLYVITLLIFVGLGCSIDQHASKSQDTNTPQNINKKIFQKHEQPIIHEVSFESGSKINFKEKASIEQNFNIKLSSLQKLINDKKLPLHPETFLPLPNTPPPQFNDEKWEEFLSKLQPEEQEFLKKMYAHKQFISYDMLAQGLAAVMEKFEELVQEDYAVAVFHNSSLQWVTSIASVYFGNSRLPVAAWEPEDFGKPGQPKELINRAQDLKVNHFLIFSDAEYNRDTLIRMLDNLDGKDTMQNKRVTAFIPFVSNYVRKVLSDKRYKRISFELVTTDFTILPTIDHLKLKKEEEQTDDKKCSPLIDPDLKLGSSQVNHRYNSNNEAVTFDNDYLAAKKDDDGEVVYEIKNKIDFFRVISKDGAILNDQEIEISALEHYAYLNPAFILLPEDNFLIDNPLAHLNKQLQITPPSVWGKELLLKKADKNTKLYAIGTEVSALPNKELTVEEAQAIFGDYSSKILGVGASGKVFLIEIDGKEYALKENASEARNLEKLQFTGGVVKVFATFSMNGKPYMVMEKGTGTLQDLNKNKEKLTESQVVAASKRLQLLLKAQERLKIINNDIKAENLLITKDNELKVIDISTSATEGNTGKNGALLAMKIFENQYQKSLLGGSISLDKYFDHEPTYRDETIMSPYVLEKWIRMVCEKELKLENCDSIKTLVDLIKAIPRSMLVSIGKRLPALDIFDKDLDLPIPNWLEENKIIWKDYFNKRKKLENLFCRRVMSSLLDTQIIYAPLFDKYSKYCNKIDKYSYEFTMDFPQKENDEEFKNWILEAYFPDVLKNSLKFLSRKYSYKEIISHIITEKTSDGSPISNAIRELYFSKQLE